MNLVDTPGTNVILQRQQRLTEEFVPRADLVLFVLSADRPLTESEVNWSQLLWLRYFAFLYYFFYSCKSILHFIYGNLHELSIVRLNSLTNNQHFVLLYFSFFLLDKAMQACYFLSLLDSGGFTGDIFAVYTTMGQESRFHSEQVRRLIYLHGGNSTLKTLSYLYHKIFHQAFCEPVSLNFQKQFS